MTDEWQVAEAKDAFRCVDNGDCEACTGEWCDVHKRKPCDCDALERHGL